MKFSEKGQTSMKGDNQVFGIDFHDFIQKQQSNDLMELAEEFGTNIRTIKKMKRNLHL